MTVSPKLVRYSAGCGRKLMISNPPIFLLLQSENHFDCYIRYCTNQVYQMREMQDIM